MRKTEAKAELMTTAGETGSVAGAITPALPGSDAADLPGDLAETRQRFTAAMDDDLNTAAALAVLFELARPLRALANRLERGDAAAEAADPALAARGRLLLELAGVLGLRPEAAAAEATTADNSLSDPEIEAQIETRRSAKAARDFANADRIRDALRARGVELIDRPGGLTDWIRR